MKKTTKQIVNDKVLDEIFSSGLSEQEQDFILYYLESNNITQSYLKAYSVDKKYATVKGYKLFHKSKIQSEIKRVKKILSAGFDVDPSKYIETQLKVANADIGDYIKFTEEEVPVIQDNGTLAVDPDTGETLKRKRNVMHLVDSSRVDTSVINEIKQGRDGITIKLMDKMKAWDNLKEFFEWKAKKEKEASIDKDIVKAITASVSTSWDKETIYDELDEAVVDE